MLSATSLPTTVLTWRWIPTTITAISGRSWRFQQPDDQPLIQGDSRQEKPLYTSYDKSYQALFAPGDSVDHFRCGGQFAFTPDSGKYSNANAWWLAEFCRLVYRIDRQLAKSEELTADIGSALATAGYRILRILFDAPTSTRAVVFAAEDESEADSTSLTLIVFCGTNAILDWRMNVQALQDSFIGNSRVHVGFKKCFDSIAEQLEQFLPANGTLVLAGHSLGAALATLATVSLSHNQRSVKACYSYGSPRIGNSQFAELVGELPVYRLVNNCDIVTGVPVSLGPGEYLHPDGAIFFSQEGVFIDGISDSELQARQLTYFPQLKKYAELSRFVARAKSLGNELPVYLADHALVNYRYRIARQLAIKTDRSP